MQRLRKAPRNWTYWVAAFTAANGIFLAMQHDIMVLAGFALPFAIPGPVPHLIIAAILVAFAYASKKIPKLLLIPLVAYIVDTAFTAYGQLWSGLAMHLVVLAFIGFSFMGIRALKTLQTQQARVGGE
jgi:uncharacterized membrane protein